MRKANIENAKTEISRSLQLGAEVFTRIIHERTQNLFQYARLLSADYAFKPAFYSGDHMTILSAMENHLARLVEAEIMLLVDLESNIIASSMNSSEVGVPFKWPLLIQKAEKDEYAEATGIVMIQNRPYQLIVVPYFAPDISAWVVLGFAFDQGVAEDIQTLVQSEISFVGQAEPGKWRVTAGTIQGDNLKLIEMIDQITKNELPKSKIQTISLNQNLFVSLAQPVDENRQLFAVLQRSLDESLKPYLRLESTLLNIFLITVVISFLISLMLAKKVTHPVKILTESASKIKLGNYTERIEINLKDEIGQLADSFNSMARGLEEKEKVRNLLGKVVSTEIAEELLSRDIELGGEEKDVSILFSDIRNFTSICEGYSAKQILNMLNIYLTAMSEAIEESQGLIDKYIGDAVMALFGAPNDDPESASHAIAAARLMSDKLKKLNAQNVFGDLTINIGIGISSGRVVAGNMGSPSRLNYTVIGDTVNLSSRLEGLTKFYGVDVIVSEITQKRAEDWVFQELDWVKVKGKSEPIKIYRPLCLENNLSSHCRRVVDVTNDFIHLYRKQCWNEALATLETLKSIDSSNLPSIYRQRIEALQLRPPGQSWDFTYEFDFK